MIDPSHEIRRLDEKDLDAFFQLRLEALQESPTSFVVSYEEEKSLGSLPYKNLFQASNKDEFVLGAFINHSLIGLIAGFRGRKSNIKHKCTLWGTYVAPNSRKQHVGTFLMEAAIDYAKTILKCPLLYLSVESTNQAAKKLYENSGFKSWGIEPYAMVIDGKPYALQHMSLTLTG